MSTPKLPPGKPGLPPSLPPSFSLPKGPREPAGPSAVERIKAESNGLRGRLAEELARDTDHFEEAEKQLVKFHGLYQQDDRDVRGPQKAYSFLLRTRVPGGKLTAEQYLVHDAIADTYGNGTLRITTRQDFQIHGVLKSRLKPTLQRLNDVLLTTLGACGDVVRNVCYPPIPVTEPYQAEVERIALQISDGLLPATRAYHEIWLDGEPLPAGEETIEPLYGKTYLPRKFKIGVTYPGDNGIDIYTQDVGLIAIVEAGRLVGFNVLVGGGLGMTHKKPDTFPRLADLLGFVTPEQAFRVVEQIVIVQRDNGDRTNRKLSRLKYLVHRWGIDRFRQEVEKGLGYALQPPAPMPPLALELYLGWREHGPDQLCLGLSVENGRVKDEGPFRLKTALREIVARYQPGVGLTANQDVLLTGLPRESRAPINALLAEHGIRQAEELSNARKYAMACPALPTCPLAISEAERVMPGVIDALEGVLEELGLSGEAITTRMTGCPNGCARPYVSDIGFVGRSLNQYTVFLGGRSDGTRLNTVYRDLVPLEALVPTLRPLLASYSRHRADAETFGDFCARLGPAGLASIAADTESAHAPTA